MKKYIIGLKDDQLNIGYASKKGKKTKILDEAVLYDDNIGRLIDSCALEVSDNLKSQLEEFVASTNKKAKQVDTVIGLESIISRTIEIPYLNKKELKAYMENNITTFFTVDMNEYYYDYSILKISKRTKEEAKKLTIMIVVIPVPIIKGLKNLVESLGLELKAIRIYPEVMMNITAKGKNVGVLDMGLNKSLVTIYENGGVFLYTSVNTGVDSLNENPYEDFIDEVEYFTDFYSSRHQGATLDALYLFGEYQNDEKFIEYAKERLGIPLEHMDYNSNKKYGSKLDINAHPQMIISQIRHKEIFNEEIDFASEERLSDKPPKVFKPIYLFGILFVLTAAWITGTWMYFDNQIQLYTDVIPNSDEFITLQEDIDDLNEAKTDLLNKAASIDEIHNREFDYNEILVTLQEVIPRGVTIRSMAITKDIITVEFNVEDETMLVTNMVVAINELGYFEDLDITEVELNDDVDTIAFELKVKVKEVE